ncbi:MULTISPECIES: cation transporter [Methylocaldum]|jgi:hypothetical protein|uniref:cation transporter n=1 Tax=Methylocaldum sp. TaxID=1969727 RepID=UPI00098A05D3|nr:cation transporter [Methylocaldum sp. BRCS4]
MDACCTEKAGALELLRGRQAKTLRIVLALNAMMFIVELVSGLIAGSVALLADALDMLGDALVYGFSLYDGIVKYYESTLLSSAVSSLPPIEKQRIKIPAWRIRS